MHFLLIQARFGASFQAREHGVPSNYSRTIKADRPEVSFYADKGDQIRKIGSQAGKLS